MHTVDEDRITLRVLIERVTDFSRYLLSKILYMAGGAFIMILLLFAYYNLKSPVYTARTSFVLDNESSASLGQLSSIASLAGVNLGGLSESGALFQIDNIQELYRSRRMIEKTLLSPSPHPDFDLLINHYGYVEELEERWNEKLAPEDLRFNKPREQLSRAQDSVLMEVVEIIQEKQLVVQKPSRKLTILEVSFKNKDEEFAKEFDEQLVKNVSDFYIETKTKKASDNLQVLQRQTDSVKIVLDRSIAELAEANEQLPNANPLLTTNQVSIRKLNIDVQTSALVYGEMVKNLEIAKVTLRNSTPLIQVIDIPILPLPDNIWKTLKIVLVGGFLGGFIVLLFYSLKYFYQQAVLEE